MEKIQIKCTKCGQKFNVAPTYLGKMVACGNCENKFKVEGSAITKQKKHYPGDKTENNSQRFTKANITTDNQNIGFQTASYQNVSAKHVQPNSPLKMLMLIVGLIFITLVITLFLIGGTEGGLLQNLDDSKRLILAGFVAIAGSILIIAGSKFKSKGITLALILGSSLAAMPFLFPQVIDKSKTTKFPLADNPETTELTEQPDSPDTLFAKIEQYKKDIGFSKLKEARIEASKEGKIPEHFKALVLTNNKVQYLDIILPYIQIALNLSDTPTVYEYGREINGQTAMLVTFETTANIKKIVDVSKRFGTPHKMDKVRSHLNVVEVDVDGTTLISQPSKFTHDKNSQNYFHANYNELRNIDRDKQIDAARRLETATNKGRQADITSALTKLINNSDHELSSQAIATLYHWTLPEYKTNPAVLEYASKITGTKFMTRPVMRYLADKNVAGAETILAKQWSLPQGHLLWENYLIKAGHRGELAVIAAIPNITESHYRSAATILTRVGTEKSIPSLNTLIQKANEDQRKFLKAAIDEIKSRQ